MKPITELWTPVLLNGGIFKDDYLVSNMGRVRQKRIYRKGGYRFVLVNIINSRRPMVKLIGGGKEYRKSVAKLVLSSFQWRDGCECANITYLDGDMKNCRLSNLRYTVDKGVYTAIELKPKPSSQKCSRQQLAQVEMPVELSSITSCKNCMNYPCFSGMKSLSSDFGAEGCRGYKQKSTNIKQPND